MRSSIFSVFVALLILRPVLSILLYGDDAEYSINTYYDKFYNNIMQSESLSSQQKHKLARIMKLDLIDNKMKQYKKQREELENKKRMQTELENSIYRKYLASVDRSSSFLKDFITMRY